MVIKYWLLDVAGGEGDPRSHEQNARFLSGESAVLAPWIVRASLESCDDTAEAFYEYRFACVRQTDTACEERMADGSWRHVCAVDS